MFILLHNSDQLLEAYAGLLLCTTPNVQGESRPKGGCCFAFASCSDCNHASCNIGRGTCDATPATIHPRSCVAQYLEEAVMLQIVRTLTRVIEILKVCSSALYIFYRTHAACVITRALFLS